MNKKYLILLLSCLCSYCAGQTLANSDVISILKSEPDTVMDVLQCDKPWELKFDYATILKTDSCYVMYYRVRSSKHSPKLSYCRAVSEDGLHWAKPDVGIVGFNGSRDNNIISDIVDGVAVEYVNGVYWLLSDRTYVENSQKRGLVMYRSDDGIHFERYEKFVVPYFCDSQNCFFWDSTTNTFKIYLRSWYKSQNPKIDYHHTHRLYRGVSLLEIPSLDYTLPIGNKPLKLSGKKEPPSISKELPMVIMNRSKSEDFDIYGGYVHKYRDNLYIAYPINYYHTDDKKRGGERNNDGYATIGFWTSNDGRSFKEVKRDYMTDGKNWMESCIGHIETEEMFVHYYITFNGTHVRQTWNNAIRARIHYKNRKR